MGISKKTIYAHFENKTKLIEATTFFVFESICDGIDHICEISENPIQELYDIKKFVMSCLNDENITTIPTQKFYPHIFEALQKNNLKK